MEIRALGPDGTPQAWRVDLTLTRPPGCNKGRVQIEDPWPRPAAPPNVPLHGFDIPVSVRRDA
jgi:hypothetical protein